MPKKLLYFIVHKPYKVLSQFTSEDGNPGLGSIFDLPKDVYPVGRLDLDSEGLLLLTNDKKLNHELLDPTKGHRRTYWIEVDGNPEDKALNQLRGGIGINVNGKQHQTRKAEVQRISPNVSDRVPPVNYKKHSITSWLEISLTEGKNRQVRKMTAKVGHPTLRLIRVAIESLNLEPLKSGEITQISQKVIYKKLNID